MLGALATAPLASGSTVRGLAGDALGSAGLGIVTPEQFGAIGDGVADDAPAIQRAMDAIAREPGGTVMFQPRVAHRCGSGLVLDASRVSWSGTALLDFSGWTGRYLRISASSAARAGEAANNYGHKGSISGAIRLRGTGRNTASTGVDFDSPAIATAAQLLTENMSISGCGTGIRFGSRAYNNLLIRCEVFDCGVCIDWPAAEDNGERNTLVGCILFNSGLAVRITLPSASLQLQGCSIDYTAQLYEVHGGSVLATSCHHESSIWEDRPIRCSGDGGFVRLDGSWMLNQAQDWKAHHLAEVGKGATVHLAGMMTHNLLLQPVDPSRPTSFASGDGEFRVTEMQSFEFSPMPSRLQTTRTQLSDPDFRSASWEDTLWRLRDTAMPIVDRYGSGADNLRLTKATIAGETGLVAIKAGGTGSAASFVPISLPVRYGEAVLAGFRVRRDPRRAGGDGTLFVSPAWVRIDGQDADRIPVIVRSQLVGTLTVTVPVDRFVAVAPLASRSGRTAPPWATHFCMIVDLSKAHETSFLFNGLWADAV